MDGTDNLNGSRKTLFSVSKNKPAGARFLGLLPRANQLVFRLRAWRNLDTLRFRSLSRVAARRNFQVIDSGSFPLRRTRMYQKKVRLDLCIVARLLPSERTLNQ